MWRSGVRASSVLAVIALSSACAVRSPRIAEIEHNRGRYLDRDVAIEGTVTTSWNVPFIPFALYKVDDGTLISSDTGSVAANTYLPGRSSLINTYRLSCQRAFRAAFD